MTSEELRALLNEMSDTELEAVAVIASTILAGRRRGLAPSRDVIDLDERRRQRGR